MLHSYECGAEPVGPAWVQFPVGFYLVALVFLVFDALAVFLFPWVLNVRASDSGVFSTMLTFLAILSLGWVYAYGSASSSGNKTAGPHNSRAHLEEHQGPSGVGAAPPEAARGRQALGGFESITEGIHSFPGGFVVTTVVDAFFNWARKSSVWPVTFGLACCAIEMMATFASRFDVERLGMVPWASPRHSDLMVVSGTVTIKMAPMLKRIYDQMPDPKWAVSMGSCANSGGPFRHGYHVVKGVDRVIPVDVYVPGCPPPPESLLNGLLLLQDQIAHFRRTGKRADPNPKVD